MLNAVLEKPRLNAYSDQWGRNAYRRPPLAERFHYCGYDILPKRQGSNWCAGIYPTRSDLPLLPRSTLDILRPHMQDVVDEANRATDRALERVPAKVA